MRTTKRHFSTMSQYWKWLKPLGHVDNIIFSGFSFPGTKGGKKKRDDWSRADLNLFLESDWYTSRASDCADRWLHLIALYRSEERRVGKECVSTCRYRCSPDH